MKNVFLTFLLVFFIVASVNMIKEEKKDQENAIKIIGMTVNLYEDFILVYTDTENKLVDRQSILQINEKAVKIIEAKENEIYDKDLLIKIKNLKDFIKGNAFSEIKKTNEDIVNFVKLKEEFNKAKYE